MLSLDLSLTGLAGRGRGVPSWVLSGAALDLDFAGNRIYGASSFTDLLSCSRASTGYAEDVAGNLTSFATNTLRRTDKGLLVEEARTNLLLRSQEFDNAIWSKGGSTTVTANQTVAPDGTTTAEKLIWSGGVDDSYVQQTVTLGAGTCTGSYYVKASGWQWVAVGIHDGSWNRVWFDLTNGVVGTVNAGISGSITALANGWYRLRVTRTTIASNPTLGLLPVNADNTDAHSTSGANVVFLWGAQFEVGPFPTSYIPTTTVAVARASDNISIAGALATLLASAAGSLVVATNASITSAAGTLVDANGNILLGKTAGDALTDNLVAGLTTGNTATWTGAAKGGIAWNASGRSIVLNNGTVVTDANAMTPAATLHLGSISGSSAFLNGCVTRLTAWSSKLVDAVLQAFVVSVLWLEGTESGRLLLEGTESGYLLLEGDMA